jgi:hypothetical protein
MISLFCKSVAPCAARACVPYIEPPIVAAQSILTTGEV